MSSLLKPICWVAGHDCLIPEQPGWFTNNCRRCGAGLPYEYFGRIKHLPFRFARGLVWLANQIERTRSYPGSHWPVYRHIDQQVKGIGTKHSCGCYSYEMIQSLLKQYKDDGLPEPLLSSLISEKGWIDLEEHPEMAEEVINSLNKSLILEDTRREQEELNK